jgi:putative oxidoreductase
MKWIKVLHWASRIFLAWLFIYAGYTKIQSPLQFAGAIEGYDLLPSAAVIWVADILPWFEIVLGVFLLSGLKIRWAAAFSAGLLGFFIVILTITYFRGIEANCGCFGVGERISPLTLVRDSLFILPALFLAFQPRIEKRLVVGSASPG